jgi:hypothetical protein
MIRISLLLGVLMFGGVTYYMRSDPGWEAPAAETLRPLRIAMLCAWIVAILLLLGLRLRLSQRTNVTGNSLLMIAWSIGEAAALFGGVYYFQSGQASWFISGLFIMLSAFILFPIRRM